MDFERLLDEVRAELRRLDGPIASWRQVPMPDLGPDEIEAAPGEIVVVSLDTGALLLTPSPNAIAVVQRYGEALMQATKAVGSDPLTLPEITGALCAEIELDRAHPLNWDRDVRK